MHVRSLIASPAKRAGYVVWVVQISNLSLFTNVPKMIQRNFNNVGELFKTSKQLFYLIDHDWKFQNSCNLDSFRQFVQVTPFGQN